MWEIAAGVLVVGIALALLLAPVRLSASYVLAGGLGAEAVVLALTSAYPLAGFSGPVLDDLGFAWSQGWARFGTIVSAQFLHGSLLHFAVNGLVLLWVGPPLEAIIGRRWLAGIYLASGALGLFAAGADDGGALRFVGASASVAGLLGASVAIAPWESLRLGFGSAELVRVPLLVVVLASLVVESTLAALRLADGIAHIAHAAGVVSGAGFGELWLRGHLRGRPLTRAA